jgi:hypothetical protein
MCKLHISRLGQPNLLFYDLCLLIRPLARFSFKHNIRIQVFVEVAMLSILVRRQAEDN